MPESPAEGWKKNIQLCWIISLKDFPDDSDGKETTCTVGDLGSIPGLGRSPGGGHGNTLQYSCLENPHRQRSLVGYSPWAHKELDMTERASTAHSISHLKHFFWMINGAQTTNPSFTFPSNYYIVYYNQRGWQEFPQPHLLTPYNMLCVPSYFYGCL